MIVIWKRALTLALLLGMYCASEGQGQAGPASQPRRISLEEAVQIYQQQNLELRLARERVAAAEARQVSAAVFPDPLFGGSREQLSGGGQPYYETVLTVGQTLEVGGQRGLRRDAAGAAVTASKASFEAERLRLAFQVHRAYIRAAAAEANLLVLGEATSVFRQVEESGQVRFVEGDISRFDRSRLQIERARYETLLARGGLDLDEAARELTFLVEPDSVSSTSLVLPEQPLASLSALNQAVQLSAALSAATSRAEVQAAAAEVESARLSLSIAQRERIPDLTISGGYKHQADGFQGAVFGLSLPLPLWNRNRGNIAEAQAELDTASARYDFVLRSAESDIRRAWQTHNSMQERSRTIGESLLPQSVNILETARVSYEEGEMSLVDLLDAADAYRSARQAVNELLADYLIATYDLERATGRLLEPAAAAATEAAR